MTKTSIQGRESKETLIARVGNHTAIHSCMHWEKTLIRLLESDLIENRHTICGIKKIAGPSLLPRQSLRYSTCAHISERTKHRAG